MVKRLIHTFVSRLLIGILFFIYAFPFFIIMLLPKKYRLGNRFVFFIINSFYNAILFSLFVRISIYGKERIPEVPAIFIANHQSSIDIPLLGSLLSGAPHVWLARSDATSYRIIRFLYSLISVVVDLSSSINSYRSIRLLFQIASETDVNLILFPEGERYSDGQVHKFIDGFVFLAKKTCRPVVPVCILGVNHVYPPGSFFLNKFPIDVIIGEPVFYQKDDTDDTFKERIVSWYNRQIRSY